MFLIIFEPYFKICLFKKQFLFFWRYKPVFFGDWLNFNSFYFKKNHDYKNMYMDKQLVY